jgi:hypothetical protein
MSAVWSRSSSVAACWLKPAMPEPNPYLLHQDSLAISGPALHGLLTSTLEQGAAFRFQAVGFSMSPFIQDGDVICIEPLRDRSPGLGQVLAFTQPASDRLIVHRLVGQRRTVALLKGDNIPGLGLDLVGWQHLHGQVILIERRGRSLKLGLGPERYLLALLSRLGLLRPLIQLILLVRGRHVR